MNHRKFILSVMFLAFALFCFSQRDSPGRLSDSLNLKVSYNSSLIYPGARLGAEYSVKSFNVAKTKKSGKKKDFDKERFVSANLGWYHHPNFQDNMYLTGGWTMRRTHSKGFFTEFSPEIGLSRTFLGGTTYKVDNNGNVSVVKLAGYYYALLTVGGGVGYDYSKVKHKPFILFYKLNLLSMYPYNSTIYVRPAMEIGLIYKLRFIGNVKSKL